VTAPVVQQPDNEVATEEPKAAEAAVTPAPAGTDDGTVTPIETAQRKRGDGPRPA